MQARELPGVMAVGREDDPTVRAAGVLPWRRRAGRLEVALVHRPKYDDWSWPKGKLEPDESWAAAAVRECLEETGLQVRLGIPLPAASYVIGTSTGNRPKLVRYWAARVADDQQGALVHEVDDVSWLSADDAPDRLDHHRDELQLAALVAADVRGALDTWPLAIVRHATSVPRGQWRMDDELRPLDRAGEQRARDLVPLLSAYAVTRVLSSSAERCTATVEPYASAADLPLHRRRPLSEQGYADEPARAPRTLRKVLARGEPTVLCTHRTVLPTLFAELAERTVEPPPGETPPDETPASEPPPGELLRESAGPGMVKGEVLVVHVRGTGKDARVVAVERHDNR